MRASIQRQWRLAHARFVEYEKHGPDARATEAKRSRRSEGHAVDGQNTSKLATREIRMRWLIVFAVTLCATGAGCEKTIHEAALPDHTSAVTRSTAAITGLTYAAPNRCTWFTSVYSW
jgi:hypothetical protein